MSTSKDMKAAGVKSTESRRGEPANTQIDSGTSQTVTFNIDSNSSKWIRGALIGSGTFSNTYLSMRTQGGELAAVKQLEIKGNHRSEEQKHNILGDLQRRMEQLKTLRHDNIILYLDSTIDHNTLNIFLEYAPGGSVASLLKNFGAFEETLTASWGQQILRGLEYLDGQALMHGRIRGNNVLVNNQSVVKLSDVGLLSQMVEAGIFTAHDTFSGDSAFWMAPEVVQQAAVTSKADIWGFGCLIIEMLTAQHPYGGLTPMQAIFKIGNGAACPVIPDMTARGREFLRAIFLQDVAARPSATELLGHVWLTSFTTS